MESIPFNVPDQIETERLMLRVPDVGDASAVAASVRASMAELSAWMVWAHEDYAESHAEEWCRRAGAKYLLREEAPYAIWTRGGLDHLGNVGAFRVDRTVRSCEVGYWLRTDATGRGLMREAVRAISEMLFKTADMRRIELRCDDRNARSAAVAVACGFTHEGTLRADALDAKGRPRSTRIYARVDDASRTGAPPV